MMALHARLGRLWDGFWFSPGTPRNLAVARVVTAATALWVVLSRDLPAMSGTPAVFWSAVPWTRRWRYLLFPGHPSLEHVVQAIVIVALAGVLLGMAPRVCAFLASLGLYHLAPLEAVFWSSSPYVRGLETPLLALMALALSPCGDAWAVRGGGPAPTTPSWAYRWPVRLIQVQICYIYFFSGYSKIVDVGVGWASAENLQAWMLVFNQGSEVKPFVQPGLWIAAHPALCQVIGVGTLLFELGFPVALVSNRLGILLAVAALLFHVGIWVMMNITVLFVLFLLVFVDWDGALPIAQRHAATSSIERLPRTSG